MPLDNSQLGEDIVNILREMPLDKTCIEGIMSYQTKVDVYDSKCQDCAFKLLIVENARMDRILFTDIQKAINYASTGNFKLLRSCAYPNDIQIKNGEIIYPTLNEIVSNSCQFWNINKLNIPSDRETKFTESLLDGINELTTA